MKSICRSCEHSHHYVSERLGTRIHCNMKGETVPPDIQFCSQWCKKGMDEYSLKQIAWILESRKGKVIGFKPPKDYKKED